MQYGHILYAIIVMSVLVACGRSHPQDSLSAYQLWAQNALMGEWTSSTSTKVYTFYSDSSFTVRTNQDVHASGEYRLSTRAFYNIQIRGIEGDIRIECLSDGEIILRETIDAMYSTAT